MKFQLNKNCPIININQLFKDCGISTAPEFHKHYRRAWVNIPCPFCTGEHLGYHLGYHKTKGYFYCWRCGSKSVEYALGVLLGISKKEAKKLIKLYAVVRQEYEPRKKEIRPKKLSFPIGIIPLNSKHKMYLKKRGYDPNQLEKEWGLMGTERFGDYKFRIIAPIFYRNQLVSYQGRDYSGLSSIKYKACKQIDEVIPHKETLYGIDKTWKNSILVVEGVTDVWRMGPGSAATFGIEFTPSQITLLSKWKNVFIMFDSDPQAIKQTEKLGGCLDGLGCNVEILELEKGDPGDLTQEEANEIMEEIK